MKTFGYAMAMMSALFLVLALAWPNLAPPLLQLLVVLLALSWVGMRVVVAGLPRPVTADAYSPFDARWDQSEAPRLPEPVGRRARRLRAADDEASARRFAVPPQECRLIAEEAARRLAEHHGLDVLEPSDESRIRALVSEPTWGMIRHWTDSRLRVVDADPVPLTYLDRILDDLERL